MIASRPHPRPFPGADRSRAGAGRRRLVDQLPDPYHSLLVMVQLEKASFADAARALGLREGSVRLLYAEGCRRLEALPGGDGHN
ncbi:MAG: sigma factor-like helix-turn-helix DNA-binding protein [Candidatus Dormibacteria bacterium]